MASQENCDVQSTKYSRNTISSKYNVYFLEVQSRNVKFPFNTLHYFYITSLAFAYYFQIQSFQNKTQEMSNFCLGWLSSEDDDE